jgi:hypothetical protein
LQATIRRWTNFVKSDLREYVWVSRELPLDPGRTVVRHFERASDSRRDVGLRRYGWDIGNWGQLDVVPFERGHCGYADSLSIELNADVCMMSVQSTHDRSADDSMIPGFAKDGWASPKGGGHFQPGDTERDRT